MTQRAPLVIGADGLPQQLQTGDTIAAPTTVATIRPVTNGESSAAAPFGTPVYATAADTVKRAQANAKATSKLAGLVFDPGGIASMAIGNIAQSGVMVGATTAAWDAVVTGQTGGLTFGSSYFLDPANVGKLTTTPPTGAGTGQCNTFIGTALSTLELEVAIAQPILL